MTIQELEQEINLHGKHIFSFCLQLTQNKEMADDLYQETWLYACRYTDKLKSDGNIKSYLLSVAVNLWKNQRRKSAWRRRIAPEETLLEEAIEELPGKEHDGLARCLDMEKRMIVRNAVNQLNDKYRIPILLYYMEEMSISEIAKTINIPKGTVKSRLNYARRCLEKELEDFINE